MTPAPNQAPRRAYRARRPLSSQRGSLLIVTMIFAAVIGISLGSYIKLAGTTLRTADRSFYANSAVDLAECGVEHAMACFYKVSTGTAAATAWTGWTLSGSNATRIFSGFTAGPNVTGLVRVFVSNYTMAGVPVIVARSTISLPSGAPIEKFVEITLGSRGPFSMGMVADDSIIVSGNNARFDSWSSDHDNDPGTAAVGYSSGASTAKCSVGVDSSATPAFGLGNADVFGTVHLAPTGTMSHGPNAVVSDTIPGSGVDSNLVTQDFSASFPAAAVPVPSFINILAASPGGGTSFPGAGDTAASDGKYYYNFGIGTSVSLSGNNAITVAANCVFIFGNHSGVTSISTSGNGEVVINSGASLVVYTNGNISSSGNGFVNNNPQPEKCVVYGTNTSSQTASITGNGSGGAAYYMPKASFTITGNGDVRGAIVAKSITLTGNAAFHYDLSLANFGGDSGVRVTKWKELRTAAERQTYATQLNF